MQIVDWVFGHALDASDERMVADHAIPSAGQRIAKEIYEG
jgi:hypothetical protein